MLVWLKFLKEVNMDRICATIPSDDSYVAYLVRLFFLYISDITVKHLRRRNINDSLFILQLNVSYKEPHITGSTSAKSKQKRPEAKNQ